MTDASPTLLCPFCKKSPRADRNTAEGRKFWPFCSLRCKTADLGSWAAERYSIPSAEAPDLDELSDGEEQDGAGDRSAYLDQPDPDDEG